MRLTLTKFISIFLLIVSLLGCFKSSVSGDVFITNNSGTVIPVSGKNVYLIPNANSEEIFTNALKSAQNLLASQIEKKISAQCEIGLNNLQDIKLELKRKIKGLDEESSSSLPKCSEPHAFGDKDILERENEIKNDQIDLERLISLREDVIIKRIDFLKSKEFDKVKISLGKMRLEPYYKKRYEYSVTIENNSDYCLSGHSYKELQQEKTDSFVFSFERGGITIDRSFIRPLNPKDANDGYLCGVPPKTKRKLFVSATINGMHNNEELSQKHGFQINGNGQVKYIEPDSVELLQHSFVENTFFLKGGKRSFINKKINWHTIIEQATEYDNKIHDLDEKILIAKNEYNKIKLCSQINLLEKAHLHLPSCADSKVGPEELYSGMMAVNDLLGVDLFNTTNLHEKVVLSTVKNIQAMIENPDVLITQTKIDGSYEFDAIARGQYLAFIQYKDAFSSVFWLNPIDATSDVTHDFNNSNLIPTSLQKHVDAKTRNSANCFSCSKQEILSSITGS